jgi:hypothetical protein
LQLFLMYLLLLVKVEIRAYACGHDDDIDNHCANDDAVFFSQASPRFRLLYLSI